VPTDFSQILGVLRTNFPGRRKKKRKKEKKLKATWCPQGTRGLFAAMKTKVPPRIPRKSIPHGIFFNGGPTNPSRARSQTGRAPAKDFRAGRKECTKTPKAWTTPQNFGKNPVVTRDSGSRVPFGRDQCGSNHLVHGAPPARAERQAKPARKTTTPWLSTRQRADQFALRGWRHSEKVAPRSLFCSRRTARGNQ